MGINILSLFDGHSTGRLVCQRAGIEVDKYYASEIDENAIKISKNNFNDILISHFYLYFLLFEVFDFE